MTDPERGSIGGFRAVTIKGTYGPLDKPLDSFYVPLLRRAVGYDRVVGYFSSRELVYAASGVSRFIANEGRLRIIVGARLAQADVDAVLSGEPLPETLARRLLDDPWGDGADIVARHHLEVLSYLARAGRLEIRIGVPLSEDGRPLTYHEAGRYFHSKYGVLTDSHGDRVAFIGSNNDTGPGWDGNHETFSAYRSWWPEVWDAYGADIAARFHDHWTDNPDQGWAVVDLPKAVEQRLIDYTHPTRVPPIVGPAEQRDGTETDLTAARAEIEALATAPRADGGTGVGLVTAGVAPLPHQMRIAHQAILTYPRGHLLADEVGLGKTIEAGLILRELLLSGRASTALLLVPASVLRQWQEELREKIGLDVPRYTGSRFLDHQDREIASDTNKSPWNAFPIVLASSHLARRRARRRELMDAAPWDIVFVDEAHHARRRGSRPDSPPNSLLSLLLEMKRRGAWRALYLATATPMQMHAHEMWDLLSLFGLPGRWGQGADWFERYYTLLRDDGRERDWEPLCAMLADYFAGSDAGPDQRLQHRIRSELGLADSFFISHLHDNGVSEAVRAGLTDERIRLADTWLRHHTPMRDHVARTTRDTLREYQRRGILPPDVVIPRRRVDDAFIPMTPKERELYDRIEDYILRCYNAYLGDAGGQALGFIMTVYRRRLTSSFHAIRRSLERRLDVLTHESTLSELLDQDDQTATEDALFDLDDLDTTTSLLAEEVDELRAFLADLEIIAAESKVLRLQDDIRESLKTHDTIVVFTQYTDTMDYLRDQLAPAYPRIACYSGRGGELWDPTSHQWVRISKTDLKTRFRDGQDVKILLGTDAMSEGLNLQTSARLINYDMPWNFMRVEQRIGRLDRVGGHRVVEVSNYFYEDTVEEAIYRGIKQDFDWFTEVVGDAQPVLASVERAIATAAMTAPGRQRDAVINDQVHRLDDQVNATNSQVIALSEAADTLVDVSPEPRPAATLDRLHDVLTTNPLTRDRFTLVPERPGVYLLELPSDQIPLVSFGTVPANDQPAITQSHLLVTFDRATADSAPDEVRLLTYATPELDTLFRLATMSYSDDVESWCD